MNLWIIINYRIINWWQLSYLLQWSAECMFQIFTDFFHKNYILSKKTNFPRRIRFLNNDVTDIWGPPSPLNHSIPLSNLWSEGSQWALTWTPMMPKDVCLSDSCTLYSCSCTLRAPLKSLTIVCYGPRGFRGMSPGLPWCREILVSRTAVLLIALVYIQLIK